MHAIPAARLVSTSLGCNSSTKQREPQSAAIVLPDSCARPKSKTPASSPSGSTSKARNRPNWSKYNVLGRDPVWVFRLEDYEMIGALGARHGSPILRADAIVPKTDSKPAETH